MQSLVPRTALKGRSRSLHDEMAKGLGFFSIALGMAELVAPRAVCRAAGIDGPENLVRAFGAREIAMGIAILASHDATPWIWGRVAGDALDIATVAAASSPEQDGGSDRKFWALAVLAGVMGLDALCACNLAAEKGSLKNARADYRDRSGFPQGVDKARGAARDFEVLRDMRGPASLRPHPLKEDVLRGRRDAVPVTQGENRTVAME